MKKVFKSIKFWIFILLVTLAGGWFIQYEIHKRDISQFVTWKPRPNIVDSQFIAGGIIKRKWMKRWKHIRIIQKLK